MAPRHLKRKLERRPKPMQKKSFVRTESKKAVIPKVLIVSEGEETEPNYFGHLICNLGIPTANAIVVPSKDGTAPINVIRYAEKYYEREGKDFEHVYLVLDRDTHSTYAEAISAAASLKKTTFKNAKTFRVITSFPCFELWYILHFKCSTKPYGCVEGSTPAKDLIKDLTESNEIFKDYDKSNGSHLTPLLDQLPNAISNAEQLINSHGGESAKGISFVDPHTLVHVPVQKLIEIAKTK